MKTVILWDKDDLLDFKKGNPYEIEVGNGKTVTLQYVSNFSRFQGPPAGFVKSNGARPSTASTSPIESAIVPARRGKKKRRTYSPAFKKAVVAEVEKEKKSGGASYYKIAQRRGIVPSVVLRWTRER